MKRITLATAPAQLSAIVAAVFAIAAIPVQAMPLHVAFDGRLDDAQASAFSLQFDIDTAAVSGSYNTGSCRAPASGGGFDVVPDVFTGFNVSGGVTNALLEVDGYAPAAALSNSAFFYNFDFSDLCKFYVGFNLEFASGLSVQSADQFLATPFYEIANFSQADLIAGALIDGYDGHGPTIASISFQGGRIGHIAEANGKVVPEPATLGLFGIGALVGALGLSLVRRKALAPA